MPWEKSFDMDEALDRATEVFWAKGYEGTSMSDLLKATGINKGSLYNAFGSKQGLFVKAILKYDSQSRKATLERLRDQNNPIGAISGLFDALIEESVSDPDKKGCFLVNTALNLPNQEAVIAKHIKSGMNDSEKFFFDHISLGKKNGDIPDHVDARSSAKGLLALVAGLRVLARGIFDKKSLRAIKSQALKIIE
ncbi:MAG: TetR/AcrR family transcriptional regulator [Pseudomonadota bacterium]